MLIPLLFALILIGYMFSGNAVPSDKPVQKLDSSNAIIQSLNSLKAIPHQNLTKTLEEDIVSNMKNIKNKDTNNPSASNTFHPVLATSSMAGNLD
tara:strand:+ start:4124 stop:4408 length:285 start_codon:yes stop_codon:yes gene_type:complete